MVDALLELQAAAGNRSVAAALGKESVQRQPQRSGRNDGGALTLDSGEVIPLQSATWSLRLGVKADRVGQQRSPELVPTKREIGNLVLTRSRDGQSARLQDLFGSVHELATLRLDRPSRDGALPATSLALRGLTIASYSVGRGDDPTETLTLAVDDLQVAGMGKEASDTDTVGYLKVGGGAQAWPPLPVVSFGEGRTPFRRPRFSRIGFSEQVLMVAPRKPFKVKLAAGMGATRLAEALDKAMRLDITVSPRASGPEVMLSAVLVVSIASSAEGPDVVDVELLAENVRR